MSKQYVIYVCTCHQHIITIATSGVQGQQSNYQSRDDDDVSSVQTGVQIRMD